MQQLYFICTFSGTLDIPDGYPNNPTAFLNKCLLTSVFVGYFLNVSFLENRSFIYNLLKPLWLDNADKKSKNIAGHYLSQIIREFLKTTTIPESGPHDFNLVAPILSEKLSCQINLIEGIQEKNAVITSYPPEYNDALPQIFLVKTLDQHVMLINNLKSFNFAQRKTFCLECKLTFYYNHRHICSKRSVCFPCKRFFSTPDTKILPFHFFEFCNSKITDQHLPAAKICANCNLTFLTENCYDGHLKLCGYGGFGRRGFKCSKCNKFTTGKSYTPGQLEREHVCTEKNTRCTYCHKIPEEHHQCKIRHQKPTRQFPNLVFYTFQYTNLETCNDCHIIRNDFRLQHQLTWKDLYNHLEFPQLSCTLHLNNFTPDSQPNCAVLLREVERGKFLKLVLADDDLFKSSLKSTEELTCNYMSDEIKKHYPMQILSEYKRCVTALQNKRVHIESKEKKTMMDKFFLLVTEASWQNTTFLALNAEVKENVSILKMFVDHGLQPFVILNGNKVQQIDLKSLSLKFLSISNFLPGSLEELKINYKIKDELVYFPEKFNTTQNYNYLGQIPHISQFINFLDTEEEKNKKIEFCNQHFLQEWSFKNSIISSLESQTIVILKASLQFLRDALDFQNSVCSSINYPFKHFIHPFDSAVSISSFSLQVFKLFFLNNFDIRTVNNEYSGCQKNSSVKEMEFVSYMEAFFPDMQFIHNFNSPTGQKKFGIYPVDLYSPVTKTVIQFYGCQIHCHDSPDCPINANLANTSDKKNCFNQSFEQVALRNAKAKEYLLAMFPQEIENVVIKWECQFMSEKLSDEYFVFSVVNGKIHRPTHRLVPRSTVRGGLLEVYRLKWSQELYPDEIFKYADVNSLYSHVAIANEFPVGKCDIYVAVHDQITNLITFVNNQHCFNNVPIVCGAAHVRVLAPSNLKFPFLQYRIKDQFNYLALCKTCAEKKDKVCKHRAEAMIAFESCWLISDLDKAVSLGYKILHWYELHHYPERAYILRDYSKMLYSEKIKNSGWPNFVQTLEDKISYCDFINSHMEFPLQFQLNINNVQLNESKRQLAKSQMNNLYGKFAQNSNFKKTEFVCSSLELDDLFSKSNVSNLFQINENILHVEHETTSIKPNLSSNIYIGAQITSYARIFVYQFIEKIEGVGGKVYSVDTDGIFYSLPKIVQDPLPFSNLCGHFKLMTKPNQSIQSFVALGPRNYSMLLSDGKTLENIVKVKGLSLKSHQVSETLSPELYSKFLESHLRNIHENILIPQEKFLIDYENSIHTKRICAYNFQNDLFVKRYIPENDGCDYETRPYGFKSE